LKFKSSRRSEACGEHYPNGLNVLWVLDNLYSYSQTALVSTTSEDLVSCFVCEHVIYHAVGVTVGELNWEGFEGVSLWYVMFDSFLELFACEVSATYALVLVVGQGCG